MSLLLPTASSTQAKKTTCQAPTPPEGHFNVCPPPGTPSLLTSAPSSCPSAYSSTAPSLLNTPHLLATISSKSSSAGSHQSDDSRSSTPTLLNPVGGGDGTQQKRSPTPLPGGYTVPPQRSPHMTPMGTPITASLSPDELRNHRHFLHHQRTQVVAFEHELLHKFILNHTNRIQSVSRGDHKVMVKMLISEAYRSDPQRRANRGRWERVMRDAMREIDSKNSVLMSVAPDPYHGALAKLSSMLLWNSGVQYWSYRYWEEEMLRRRSVQQSTLNQLRGRGLFLAAPAIPTVKKFA